MIGSPGWIPPRVLISTVFTRPHWRQDLGAAQLVLALLDDRFPGR